MELDDDRLSAAATADDPAALRAALAEAAAAEDRPYLDENAEAEACDAYYRDLGDVERMGPVELHEALGDLVARTHTTQLRYKPAQEVYPWVDLHRDGGRLEVRSIYSGKSFSAAELIRADFELEQAHRAMAARIAAGGRIDGEAAFAMLEQQLPYNCEHVVPQSWFDKREPMRGDLHHLFACESGCNSFRGNTPYFDFADFGTRIRNECGRLEQAEFKFEPANGKGPIARATLYFLLRYPGRIDRASKEYTEDRLAILLDWHARDPVDIYERHRNQAIAEKQGNRNPLIDFPEWAARIAFAEGLGRSPQPPAERSRNMPAIPTVDDLVLDDLPDAVRASIEVRDRYINRLGLGGVGAGVFEFVVSDLLRWLPGQTVRVAFLDGDTALHRDIRDATAEITAACNIRLDFGEDAAGNFRRWMETDTEYAAEIRVSFDKGGYFSLVGTDSNDAGIGSPEDRIGGRAHQCSLNLGGYTVQRPATWKGTTRHEFMHALGFHHSHQNMRGPCQESFRWDDDLGYVPVKDDRGGYVPDAQGRRPGIYTYLAGYPNNWSREKVDHNLKTEEDPSLVVGPFDNASVMLYRFPDSFYKSLPSPCAPRGDGQSLSEGDIRGLRLLYPQTAAQVETAVAKQQAIVESLRRSAGEAGAAARVAEGDAFSPDIDRSSAAAVGGSLLARSIAVLERKLLAAP